MWRALLKAGAIATALAIANAGPASASQIFRYHGGPTAWNQWFATPTAIKSFQNRAIVSVANATAWASNGQFTSSATLSVYQTYQYGTYRLSCKWTIGNHGDKPVLQCDSWE